MIEWIDESVMIQDTGPTRYLVHTKDGSVLSTTYFNGKFLIDGNEVKDVTDYAKLNLPVPRTLFRACTRFPEECYCSECSK